MQSPKKPQSSTVHNVNASLPWPCYVLDSQYRCSSEHTGVLAHHHHRVRSHILTINVVPDLFPLRRTLITSLMHPLLAAAACSTWVAFRAVYTVGYSSGDPAKVSKMSTQRQRQRSDPEPEELARRRLHWSSVLVQYVSFRLSQILWLMYHQPLLVLLPGR